MLSSGRGRRCKKQGPSPDGWKPKEQNCKFTRRTHPPPPLREAIEFISGSILDERRFEGEIDAHPGENMITRRHIACRLLGSRADPAGGG